MAPRKTKVAAPPAFAARKLAEPFDEAAVLRGMQLAGLNAERIWIVGSLADGSIAVLVAVTVADIVGVTPRPFSAELLRELEQRGLSQ